MHNVCNNCMWVHFLFSLNHSQCVSLENLNACTLTHSHKTHETRSTNSFGITCLRKCINVLCLHHRYINIDELIPQMHFEWKTTLRKYMSNLMPPSVPSTHTPTHTHPLIHSLYSLTLVYFSIKTRVNRKTSSGMYSQNVYALFFLVKYFDIILDTENHATPTMFRKYSMQLNLHHCLNHFIYWVRCKGCKCKMFLEV